VRRHPSRDPILNEDETDVLGIFSRFTDIEATGQVVKEAGFLEGNVEYVGGVTGPVAQKGIYHGVDNPDGEELVAVVKL